MTRIIGGEAGGRRIAAPPGRGTRPTADRVREALFSSLDATIGSLRGLRVLDLYAGSGAVGLEARSRGADTVTLVEQDRRAAAVIRRNASLLEMSDVEVRVSSVLRALETPPRAPYDLVYVDPPYALGEEEVGTVLRSLGDLGWLAEGALVVVERSSRSGAPAWPAGITADRSRTYGETVLWYGRADPPDRTA
jgi:16S rRNA (guanine966-N2)-methyltransferase